MTTTTIAENSSVRVVPGFTQRLDEALAAAGYRAYGRQQVVRQFSGLTQAGVKKMYTEDRPPRPRTLDQLLNNLAKVLSEVQGTEFPVAALKDYLLLERGSLECGKKTVGVDSSTSKVEDEFDIAEFVRRDPVYTSQIIIRIEEVAREIGIDTAKQMALRDMRLIQFRIVSYCHKNHPDVDSPKVSNMISSLFELAIQGLL